MDASLLRLLRDTRRARNEAPAGIAPRQRARLADMVAHARAHSPYYRALYRDLPARIEDAAVLPVTDKKALMARFDDWATDRAVTLAQARAFIADPALIGARFLGRYTLATTSGTTGTPGIFALDDRSLEVANALALRMLRAWLGIGDVVKIIMGGARIAMVNATGGHYASAVAAARLRRSRFGARRSAVYSVHTPLPEMVAALNRLRPAVLAPYASAGALLASEQEAGRLRIAPALVVLAAEGLALPEYDRIARAFNAKLGHSYAATECPFLSYSCEYHWLHVNSDWVVLEPVDANFRPVAPGVASHTVLISNLANRAQPILRYDLGDSVLARPDPCPCGNPLPAIRVRGRAGDALVFLRQDGAQVRIAPLAFELDHIPGIALFQIVQTAPARLRVRLRLDPGAEPDGVWRAVHAALARLLRAHGLDQVAIERADEPPEPSAGGKYRTVVPLREAAP